MLTQESYILSRPDSNEFVCYYYRREDCMSIGWSISIKDSLVFNSPFEAASVGGNVSEAIEQPIEMWELLETIDDLQITSMGQYQPQALRQKNSEVTKN